MSMHILFLIKLKTGERSFLRGQGDAGWDHPSRAISCYKRLKRLSFVKFEMIQNFLCHLVDLLTNMYSGVRSSVINFVDRFSKIKEDLPSCTLIVILSLKQGVGIGTLQHEKESSIRLQYKNLVKECRNRIQDVSEESSCQREEGLIIYYIFQDKKYWWLWCCLTDHASLEVPLLVWFHEIFELFFKDSAEH